MGEADGEGIGFIGQGVVAQTKESTGHKGDLFFSGGAFAGGRFFYKFGGIFMNGEPASGGGEEGDPAGGTQDHGGAGVLDVDNEFDGKGGRSVLGDEFGEAIVDFDEAIVGGAGGGIFNCAGDEDRGFFSRAFENGVTGGPKGGVKGENTHRWSVPRRVELSREADEVGLTQK